MNEKRNVMLESARIARGNIKDLATIETKEFDAIIIPGGFGAAKNLSSFGFKGEIGHSMSAGYYADPKYLVNRVSFPKNFSETTCPSDCYSVQAEITLKQGTNKDRFSNDFLIQDTLKMLKETSAIPETATPLFSKIDFFENAYVVYDVDYENKINVIKKYFEKRNIYLHGRFGSHNYLNVDGCVIESKKLVEKILNMTISLDDFFYGLDFSVVQK